MDGIQTGRVISLDRNLPLVRTAIGTVRAQHAADLLKNSDLRAAVGDYVTIEQPAGQDTPLITNIHPRNHVLARRQLVESIHEGEGKFKTQVLAANIDAVCIVSALGNRPIDLDYLERQLVMAHDSGAPVLVLLTKADASKQAEKDLACARAAAPGCKVIALSAVDGRGFDELRAALGELEAPRSKPGGDEMGITAEVTGVLLGRSGVGKSTLVNELLGAPLLRTGAVRKKDRAGRHTTVARKLVELPRIAEESGSRLALIDVPGLRSLGLYGAHEGLAAAFPEIVDLAAHCYYRDCSHTDEPDCAVVEAEQKGYLSGRRVESYRTIAAEVED
jgi:ribosome biogenesis GTPase